MWSPAVIVRLLAIGSAPFFFLFLLCVGGAWCEDGRLKREGVEGGGGSDGVGRGEDGRREGDGGGEERRSITRRVRKRSVHILVSDIPANIPGARSSLSLFSLFLSLFPFSVFRLILAPSLPLSLSLSLSFRRFRAIPRDIRARASEMIIYKV